MNANNVPIIDLKKESLINAFKIIWEDLFQMTRCSVF